VGTDVQIAVVVEGHGETDAVPVLLRRIVSEVAPEARVKVACQRVPFTRLQRPGELEGEVEIAVGRLGGRGGVLVLADCEDDCPARLGPALLARVRQTRSDIAASVVLAKREFESWFLAAAESLAGRRGLPAGLIHPDNHETIRGAKEWLSKQLPAGRIYKETTDQAAFAAVFDMAKARERSDSFDKCYREIGELISEVISRTRGRE
jgi:hypothetical protein